MDKNLKTPPGDSVAAELCRLCDRPVSPPDQHRDDCLGAIVVAHLRRGMGYENDVSYVAAVIAGAKAEGWRKGRAVERGLVWCQSCNTSKQSRDCEEWQCPDCGACVLDPCQR